MVGTNQTQHLYTQYHDIFASLLSNFSHLKMCLYTDARLGLPSRATKVKHILQAIVCTHIIYCTGDGIYKGTVVVVMRGGQSQ